MKWGKGVIGKEEREKPRVKMAHVKELVDKEILKLALVPLPILSFNWFDLRNLGLGRQVLVSNRFVVLDMDEYKEIMLILGQPILATEEALIDLKGDKLTYFSTTTHRL
ncbi:hypothetical protein OSB04_025140 [Centaurea solstitialis]|uniref:Uncharacterized protein n=1 Tax=Centaurea solstitialis TaxID=347529 RepID=A0AA38SV45_9ASTR|nr:hypothetical protein OSB04_025140 [Centaurea solstitialis]